MLRGARVNELKFSQTPLFQGNVNLINSKKISHTLCIHDVSTITVSTCITYIVNVCKDDFYQPNFTHIIDNSSLIVVMHLPFQKVKKTIVWGRYIDCDNRRFFLYICSSHLFTSRKSIYILQRRSSSHICLMWNVVNFMTDEV